MPTNLPPELEAQAREHDCSRYAIHGAIAANYFNCHGIQQCMKCNRWRDIAVGINKWQPWDTLSEHVRKRRGLRSLAGQEERDGK